MSLFKLKEVVELQPVLGEFFHTGSRVICDPPPKDTDDDYIVLVGQGAFDYVKKTLSDNGWKLGGSFDPTSKNPFKYTTFVSYKKEEYNLILTHSQDYFESFKRATYLASHLNLLKKEDRVTLFEAVVRDNYPTKLKIYGKRVASWTDMFKVPGNFAVDIDFAQPEPPVVAPRILNDVGRVEFIQLAPLDRVLAEEREVDALDQLILDRDAELEVAQEVREAGMLRDAIRENAAMVDLRQELAAEELEQERELD